MNCGCSIQLSAAGTNQGAFVLNAPIRYCALHAKANEMLDILKEVLTYSDEPREDCLICDKGIFGGHDESCVIPKTLALISQIEGTHD